MIESDREILNEIRDMLKVLIDEHRLLRADVHELREEQRKIQEELKLSNFVLHNIGMRNEILN